MFRGVVGHDPGLAGAGDRDAISLGQLLRLERQLRVRKFSEVRMDPRLKQGQRGSNGNVFQAILPRQMNTSLLRWANT